MEITIQINGQAVEVDVSIEVYTYLDQADHKAENLAHEQRRHWDVRELDEYIIASMCADFALHDKDGGNPHAHILLTLRPFKGDGTWGAKCRKEYDLDEQGQRIRTASGAFKSHRVNTTDWNDKGKAEQWRSDWADYLNRGLEQKGIKELVDHRSYQRQVFWISSNSIPKTSLPQTMAKSRLSKKVPPSFISYKATVYFVIL